MGNKKKHRKSKRNKKKVDKLENENGETLDQSDTLELSGKSNKRQFNDEDSDFEEQPKRKKKKKIVPLEGVDGKGKKSIRQIKREKFAERQAHEVAIAKDALKQQCLNYLSLWKHARTEWKFMKARQVWLLKNKFSSKLIPDESWQMLLEYFESAKGNIRKTLLNDANEIIQKLEKAVPTKQMLHEDNAALDEDTDIPDVTTCKRARDLIQYLQE